MPNLIQIKSSRGVPLPPMDKREAHEQMRAESLEGRLTIKDIHSQGFIINSEGYILIQHRPETSADNADLDDKSWGAHVEPGDTSITSAIFKSGSELGIPLAVLDEERFYDMLTCHPDITRKLAVTRRLAHLRNYKSERVLSDGDKWIEPCETSVFIGYYDGPIQIPQKDGAGLKWYTRESLARKIDERPERFTGDLRDLVQRYYDHLVPFRELPGIDVADDFTSDELVLLYSLEGEVIGAEPRKGIHEKLKAAYREGTKQPSKHRHVRIVLLRSDGTLWLQKRSEHKKENPGMIDKPIGGHGSSIDSYETAALHECMDELSIPATVLQSDDFYHAVKYRPEILRSQAVLMQVREETNYKSTRHVTGEEPWIEIGDSAFFIGYYDGEISFKDGEAVGVEVKSVDALKADMKAQPTLYTQDLKDIVDMMGHMMVPREQFGQYL